MNVAYVLNVFDVRSFKLVLLETLLAEYVPYVPYDESDNFHDGVED